MSFAAIAVARSSFGDQNPRFEVLDATVVEQAIALHEQIGHACILSIDSSQDLKLIGSVNQSLLHDENGEKIRAVAWNSRH